MDKDEMLFKTTGIGAIASALVILLLKVWGITIVAADGTTVVSPPGSVTWVELTVVLGGVSSLVTWIKGVVERWLATREKKEEAHVSLPDGGTGPAGD